MATIPVRVLLFLSSYAPLFAIISIRELGDNRAVAIITLVLALIGAMALFGYICAAARLSAVEIQTIEVHAKSGETMAYIVTYVIPFLDFDLGKLEDVIALVLLLGVIAMLYVHSNLVVVNPLLNLVGFHLFEIRSSDGITRTLLSRRSFIPSHGKLTAVTLGNYALLEKL